MNQNTAASLYLSGEYDMKVGFELSIEIEEVLALQIEVESSKPLHALQILIRFLLN